MSKQTYITSQAATMAGISDSTLRNWSKIFGDHLSASATPAPGAERRFTETDIALLQIIADLRGQGLSYDQITSRLQDIDPDQLQPFVDIAPDPTPEEPAPLAPQPSPQSTQQATVGAVDLQIATAYLQAIAHHTDPIREQIDDIKREQASKLTWFAIGFCCGLAVALIAVLALGLGVSVGG